jgi:hypothetical protein
MVISKISFFKAAAVTGVLLLGVTECAMLGDLSAVADTPQTQRLEVSKRSMNIIEISIEESRFKRAMPVIVEVSPWLKADMQSIKISDPDLISVLKQAGFSGNGLRMAWAVVKAESTSRVYAHNRNRNTGDNSYGLFQINMIDGLGPARLEKYGLEKNEDLFTPLVNAQVAFKISNGGTSWGAWTTHKKASAMLSQFPG